LAAISRLRQRADIDPVVWLIQLSHDPEERVRARALEELAAVNSPDAKKRVAEMAGSDPSESIRQAARRWAPVSTPTTAELPPLPGSPRLTPRAN
jgi:hypothetical protein